MSYVWQLSMREKTQTPIKPRIKTPKRIGSSIKKDAIHPKDFNSFILPFACEDCSHFKGSTESCTLGLTSEPHLRRNQIHSYELSGKMALCRFQEID
jgi:hypothetical protein